MNLVEYVLSKGFTLAKKSGEEWAGPCPSCGGHDRFVVFETGGREGIAIPGRFMCRKCHERGGDFVEYLHTIENLPLAEALKQAGARTGRGGTKREAKRTETRGKQVSAVSASEAWSGQAGRVLSSAWQGMKTQTAAEFFRDSRGLTGETCKALGFGWQEADSYFPPEMWGLSEGKTLAVPAGAVLPVRRGGRVVSLLVRRSDKSQWERWGKWCEVRGGAKVPFLCGPSGAPLVVCESILCAASVYQASGGTVAALATLGASKPILDTEAVDFLKAAAVVLIAGDRDGDERGEKLYSSVWAVRFDAEVHSVPSTFRGEAVKDINDLLQVGGSGVVKWWLDWGIDRYSISSPAMPEPCEPSSDALGVVEDEAGPDEFAAHVEQVRAAWPDGAPMQCQDVPDWSAFCSGWWRDCFVCPYYDGNSNESPCTLWEAAFPGVVRWYAPGAGGYAAGAEWGKLNP